MLLYVVCIPGIVHFNFHERSELTSIFNSYFILNNYCSRTRVDNKWPPLLAAIRVTDEQL